MDVEEMHDRVNLILKELEGLKGSDLGKKKSSLLKEAFTLEYQVANSFRQRLQAQPFRAHLFTRAAQLANRIFRFNDALDLTEEGLRGDVPEDLHESLLIERDVALEGLKTRLEKGRAREIYRERQKIAVGWRPHRLRALPAVVEAKAAHFVSVSTPSVVLAMRIGDIAANAFIADNESPYFGTSVVIAGSTTHLRWLADGSLVFAQSGRIEETHPLFDPEWPRKALMLRQEIVESLFAKLVAHSYAYDLDFTTLRFLFDPSLEDSDDLRFELKSAAADPIARARPRLEQALPIVVELDLGSGTEIIRERRSADGGSLVLFSIDGAQLLLSGDPF